MSDNEQTTNEKDTSGIRVFVYGTLKRGHPNHDLLDDGDNKYLGRCYLEGSYLMLDLHHFPGIIRSDGAGPSNRIYGEVYRISDETLFDLDILEGNGSFYTREKVQTPWKKAWAYFLPEEFKESYSVIEGAAWFPTSDERAYIEAQQGIETGTDS